MIRHLLLWLSLIWPFHHQVPQPAGPSADDAIVLNSIEVPPVPVDPGQGPRIVTPHGSFYVPMNLCDKTDEGDYLFLGPDGVIGVASTCDGAFLDWNETPAPRPLPRA